MRRPLTAQVEAPPVAPTPKPRTVRRPVTTSPDWKMTKGSDVGGEGPYTESHLNDGPHPAGEQPYCTCPTRGDYTFDPQIGIYLHPQCWKPSKAYYNAAKAAGIIKVKE